MLLMNHQYKAVRSHFYFQKCHLINLYHLFSVIYVAIKNVENDNADLF